MFTHYHAAEFEVASHRARRRWAENIDQLLADEPDLACADALHAARGILLDSRVKVQSADLHELLRVLRDGSLDADGAADAIDAFVASYRQPV